MQRGEGGGREREREVYKIIRYLKPDKFMILKLVKVLVEFNGTEHIYLSANLHTLSMIV